MPTLPETVNISLTDHDALLIVDVQNDFLPGGSLGVEDGDAILAPINAAIELFSGKNLPVFASRDYHPRNHSSFTDQGGIWPAHCVAGTRGAEFASELRLSASTTIISKATLQDKDAYSALEGTELGKQLTELTIRRVFIGGLATDYCVAASARDLLQQGFDVVILCDAIKGVNIDPDDSEKALAELCNLGALKTTVELLD